MGDFASHMALTGESIIARLEDAPLTSWQIKLRLVVGTATFFNAFEVLAIAYALPELKAQWHLTQGQSGFLLSALFVGEIIGALLFGMIAETRGRRAALIGCTALYSAMSLAASLAPNYYWLVAARLLTGIGLGAEVPIAVTYISEIAKAKGRGRFVLLYELVFPLGLLAGALLGWWFILRFGWRPFLAIGALPAILVLPMMIRLVPESPRWLVHRGRLSEADAIVRRIEGASVAFTTPGPALWNATKARVTDLPGKSNDKAIPSLSFAILSGLFSKGYGRRTAMLWTMYFCCFFMNYGLVTWLPMLYHGLFHLSLSDSLRNAMITQAAGFSGTLTTALAIDLVGRRIWFGTAFLLAAAAFFNLGVNGLESANHMLVGGCISFYFVSAISIGMILYAPELYPTRMRVIGVSLGYAVSILAGIVAPMAVGLIVETAGLGVIFAIFACLGALAGATCLIFAVETRNRSLELISP